MAKDKLHTVLRLRRQEVDACRAELVLRETRAHAAAIALHEAEETIQAEMAAATRLSADDAAVEAFGAWLPKGRNAVARADTTLARAQDEAVQARAHLNLARASAEAVEKLLEKKAEAASQEALRKQQHVLDEIGQRPRPRLLE
jgi:flagellar export protein FliJ